MHVSALMYFPLTIATFEEGYVMTEPTSAPPSLPAALRVAAAEDRFGDHRGLGVSEIMFKVTPADSSGLLILENSFHAKGGPARHLHYEQDEWFYSLEGSSSLRLAVSGSHSSLVNRCWRRAEFPTSGRTSARAVDVS